MIVTTPDLFDLAKTRASGLCDRRADELEATGAPEDAAKAGELRQIAIQIRHLAAPRSQ